jgi:hypothetical protein
MNLLARIVRHPEFRFWLGLSVIGSAYAASCIWGSP